MKRNTLCCTGFTPVQTEVSIGIFGRHIVYKKCEHVTGIRHSNILARDPGGNVGEEPQNMHYFVL